MDAAGALVETLKARRVAFTGRLASMPRRAAAAAVESAGGIAVTTVSRRTSVLVVGMDGWPLLRDGSVSRKLGRAEAINRGGGRIRIVSEAVFLEIAGLRARAPQLRKSYPAGEVCTMLGIQPFSLRRWEAFGLIRAESGRYDFQDIVSLRTIAGLVAAGVEPQAIARSIRRLAAVLPGTERPLSQLKIVIEHPGELLAELGEQLVAPDGQLMLNFAASGGAAAPAVAVAGRAAPESAEELITRGVLLEQEERLEAAAAAYGAALQREPQLAEGHFNLGNVLRNLGRAEAAEQRYRVAVDLDPSLGAAWYNLADLLEEAGRIEEACGCLERAVAVEAGYADAHFNLACCYDQLGRRDDAARQWRAYLQLDPASEWAEVARNRLRDAGHGSTP